MDSEGGHPRTPFGQASATSHRGWKMQGTPWAGEAVPAKTINMLRKGLDGLTEEEGTTGEGRFCPNLCGFLVPVSNTTFVAQNKAVPLTAELMFSCEEIKKEGKQRKKEMRVYGSFLL